MATKYITEDPELLRLESQIVNFARKIKLLNHLDIDIQVLELMNLNSKFKRILHATNRHTHLKGSNLSANETLNNFMGIAYENGVKNLNPFIKHFCKYTSKPFKKFKEELEEINKENSFEILNISSCTLDNDEVREIKTSLKRIIRHVNKINKGDYVMYGQKRTVKALYEAENIENIIEQKTA